MAAERILMIDNFDSFTYNVAEEFARRGCQIKTYRNSISFAQLRNSIREYQPHLIVISPGPGHPNASGISIPLIQKYQGEIPIVGVCLGHQAIVSALGGEVARAPQVVHGKSSLVYHNSDGLFDTLPNPFTAARYHSLCATQVPDSLEVSAHTAEGLVMAVRSKDSAVFLEGLQFHPESIMTTLGGQLVVNIIKKLETKSESES